MKKVIVFGLLISILAITGCKRTPKTYGDVIDFSQYDDENGRVIFAYGKNGCYSDGSRYADRIYNNWVKQYQKSH